MWTKLLSLSRFTRMVDRSIPFLSLANRSMLPASRRGTCAILLGVGLGIVLSLTADAADPNSSSDGASKPTERSIDGSTLWKQSCADCHGASGQGESGVYDHPLTGDASIGELTRIIADTMPEGEPELIVGDEAAAIAAYIHETFYGPAAQLRLRPPSIQLSRLTGDQLRSTVADLYAAFTQLPFNVETGGLSAIYNDGSGWKKDQHKVERVDDVIDFDFGKESPAEGIGAEDYRIEWSGSIIPPRTGTYEIVLKSTCGCELDFERRGNTLVDNLVQSEGRDEFRRSVRLIGGRPYAVTLRFIQKKRKTEQPPAKVSLSWVPPNGPEQLIPAHCLSPRRSGLHYTLQTKLPPDDGSYGYSRGTSVDLSWDASVTSAAVEFGSVLASEVYPDYRRKKIGKDAKDADRKVLREFLTDFLQLAFRGGIDEAAQAAYLDAAIAAEADDAMAIRRTVLMAMKSPRFLYPDLPLGQTRSRQIVNRLAVVMFDSAPVDPWLLKAAEDKDLSENRVRSIAERMLGDVRATAKVMEFFRHYLDIEDEEIVRDPEQFEGFDRALVEDLRTSLDMFLMEILQSEASDFRQLLAADWTYANDRLQSFYGDAFAAAGETDDAFHRTQSNPQVHVGVLTHPLLMSGLAYHDTTSPIHRGVFLTRHLFGRVLRPPNAAFTPLDPDLHPGLTTRQRVTLQTAEVNCQVCHSKINGLGFALENFDATGRFRAEEVGKKIDASGIYVGRDDREVRFDGARELGQLMIESEDVQRAFVEAAFEYMVKQPPAAFGSETADRLLQSFRDNGFHVRKLIAEIAVVAAIHESQDAPSALATAAK